MELTREQIERIRMWLERRCMLDTEMNRLCDMARRSLQSDSRAVEVLREYSHDGRLQTFQDRERFREAARSVLSPPAPDDQDSASDVRKGGR